MSEFKLKKEHLANLKLLSDMFRGNKLADNDKKAIAEFIHACVANEELSSIANNRRELTADRNIHIDAIFTVVRLVHYTRRINTEAEKFHKDTKLLSPEEIEIRKKLFERAVSYSLRCLHPTFNQLKDITEYHPELQILHERINKSLKTEQELQTTPAKKEILDALRAKKEITLFTPLTPIDEFIQYWANVKATLVVDKKETPHP